MFIWYKPCENRFARGLSANQMARIESERERERERVLPARDPTYERIPEFVLANEMALRGTPTHKMLSRVRNFDSL